MAEEEKPAKTPMKARAPKNCHTSPASPIKPVNSPIAKEERSSDSLRPCLSAIRPQSGEAKAATKDVEPVMMPDQMPTPSTVFTPRSGSIRGIIGEGKLIDPVMMNGIAPIAHGARAQRACAGGSTGPSARVGGAASCGGSVIARHAIGTRRHGKRAGATKPARPGAATEPGPAPKAALD